MMQEVITMRHVNLWKRTRILAGTAALAAALTLTGACGIFADEADSASEAEVEIAEDENEDEDEEVLTDDELDTESDLDWELEELDPEDLDDAETELTPEEEELNEYIDANFGDELLKRFKSFRYSQTMWNSDGTETESTGSIYEEDGLVASEYVDNFKEIITKDRYDGFDPQLNAPVRYVFDSDESREDMMLNYEELFYLWGDETVTEKSEKDGKVTFVTEMTDTDLISLILSDYDGEIGDSAVLTRTSTFDIETKVLEDSFVKLKDADGTEHDIFECKFEVEPEEGYTEDTELLAKLDAADTHTLTLVIDPGTEDEVKVESSVGKGCAFYPLLYDGYSYFKDEKCEEAADDDYLYNTEDDITLYAVFEEIYDDEDVDIEDGSYDLEFDDSDIDMSELFEDEEGTESIVG